MLGLKIKSRKLSTNIRKDVGKRQLCIIEHRQEDRAGDWKGRRREKKRKQQGDGGGKEGQGGMGEESQK